MNPRHPGWWVLPLFGITAGLLFRPSEAYRIPSPERASVESRTLCLPDGSALRFLRGPDMEVYLSQTEVPPAITGELFQGPLSFSKAGEFCAWLSDLTGQRLRLPTAAEWRQAARAGVDNAEFAWGFAPASPPPGIHFGRETPPSSPGPAFGYGFRDLAGGTWEWTAEGQLLGSAWSERNPETLRIEHAWSPPPGYRDRDTGVRLAWEAP